MPMILVEAMAVGVPVVGTDVGDVRSILEGAGAGIAVPSDDFEAFYEACRNVLSDSDLHRRLAERAREGSRSFDSEVMADRYEALFEAAVDDQPVPANLR
jgi:L-malate glycosyltransferase